MSEGRRAISRWLLVSEILAAILFGIMLLLYASQWPPSIRANNSIVAYVAICMLRFTVVAGLLNLGVLIRNRAANEYGWKATGMRAGGMALMGVAVCLIPLLLVTSFPQY